MLLRTNLAFVAALLCSMLIGVDGTARAAPVDCDPMAAKNDQAKALRVGRDLGGAKVVVNQVLAIHKSDFRANYTAALIAVDENHNDRAKRAAAIKQLEAVAALLHAQDPSCAVQKNYYSIYNSIGVEYFNIGDYKAATTYFDLANANQDKLNSDTRAKLLDNLGLARYKSADYVCAAYYFRQAQQAGVKSASPHLALVQVVLTSADDQRQCKEAGARLGATMAKPRGN